MDKLSGKSWVSEFIGKKNINDLASPFQSNVQAFISALKKSGARITISATLRPSWTGLP